MSLVSAGYQENILILVDGLHEYTGNRFRLIELLEELSRSTEDKHVKVCIASRPEKAFLFKKSLSLYLDDQNAIRVS